MKSFSYESMGTTWKISLWDEFSDDSMEELKNEIFSMSDQFDRTYSRFIKTSLVWEIAEGAGKYEVPEDFIAMLDMYIDLYEPSDKSLNPLIGFTISDLGYDDPYSLKAKEIVRLTPDLNDSVKIVNRGEDGKPAVVETTLPVLFDFGALGKGYFVDKIATLLKEKGIKRFLVDGSGDIYYSGGPDKVPIKSGLEHPGDSSMIIGTTSITEGALCASGTSRRKWGEHHHVIDPHTGTSTDNCIVATWVSTSSAVLADAIATCLFFVAPETLLAHGFKFEYAIQNSENMIKKSSAMTEPLS